MLKIKNASVKPKRYFGLHMVPGVAEYREIKNAGSQEAYRILIEEAAIKNMDASFDGCPLFVMHVDEVEWANIEHEADGWVVRSFYNKADGKHWAEFMVVTDRGHEAISKGWKLSNAYQPDAATMGPGGTWHGVEYAREVHNGVYEHLAIVPNPRYQESVILTPEDFKKYNSDKEQELVRLANSLTTLKTAQGGKPMFEFWKKSKVENADDASQMMITLPKSKREVSILTLVNEADQAEVEKEKENSTAPATQQPTATEVMANVDHMVEVGEKKEKMSVNDLLTKYSELTAKNQAVGQPAASENPTPAETNNEDDADKEAKAAQKQNAMHFDALKNAPDLAVPQAPDQTISLGGVSVGKKRYGSN